MRHARKIELSRGIELFLIETVKKSSGSGPIKAAVMKTEPNSGHVIAVAPFGFSPASPAEGQSPLGCRDAEKKSSGNRLAENEKKEPPGKTGRLEKARKSSNGYLLTMFSTMFPMIGSLNFS
jgi:hypothetical protein